MKGDREPEHRGGARLIALVGGSGAGKSWLAERLEGIFAERAGRVSQDSFYLDRSHLSAKRREMVNYDQPRAIDWALFEKVLRAIRSGEAAEIPEYDFTTHCRTGAGRKWMPKGLVLVDGLWLLSRVGIRGLFDLTIFLECEAGLRLKRRLARDQAERGRSAGSVQRQFKTLVAPMHERFVAPQKGHADLVFEKPVTEAEVLQIARRIDLMGSQTGGLRYSRLPACAPSALQN